MVQGLPPRLAEIADLIGLGEALTLAAELGGRSVYCPLSADQAGGIGARLVELIGTDKAAAFCAQYGGGEIVIPTGRSVRLTAEVARLTEADYSAARAARALGVTERTVWRHRARIRDDEPALPDLFLDIDHPDT